MCYIIISKVSAKAPGKATASTYFLEPFFLGLALNQMLLDRFKDQGLLLAHGPGLPGRVVEDGGEEVQLSLLLPPENYEVVGTLWLALL